MKMCKAVKKKNPKAPVNVCVKIKNTKTNRIKIVQLNDINQIIKGWKETISIQICLSI